jgi:hypothetical protein
MSFASPNDLDLCMRVRAMCACNQLRRATRGITQLYEAEMAPGGLKVTQLPILVALRSEGDLSVTRLAGALSLDRTTLTRNVSVLEQRADVLAGALACWEDVQNVVEERFGGERLRALYEELAALSDAVNGDSA